jgi:hypothetical protein
MTINIDTTRFIPLVTSTHINPHQPTSAHISPHQPTPAQITVHQASHDRATTLHLGGESKKKSSKGSSTAGTRFIERRKPAKNEPG